MRLALKIVAVVLAAILLAAGGAGVWYFNSKLPQRKGDVALKGLSAPVSVDYDERGVPHIRAQNEADLYRTLGYVHAQDRLFQMEVVRRLAQGELAEILGPKLVETDKLFRTLQLRQHAIDYVARMDMSTPASKALLAYLDGINQYQATHPAPVEFDILGIPKRPFTPQDTMAVSGYLAYSFAAAFRTEPVMTFIRDKLGPDYLRAFDIEWHPEGVMQAAALTDSTWNSLAHVARASTQAMDIASVPLFEGSNAWAISSRRSASGKPILAGDPHIAYAAPAVWYEAHLSSPGFELYGHYQALNPVALLGHNERFGWSLTMFQNDDLDLIAEQTAPDHPNQVMFRGEWVDMQVRTETIAVKGGAPVQLSLRRTPNGPVINDAFSATLGAAPVSMWWAFLETENPILEAFYELNRADTRDKAREAVAKIHSPGLNIVWASASGDIAWWAAGKLPQRPTGVNPSFILDASKGEAEKLGYYAFQFNPQEENPARGYIVSANHQPRPPSGVPVPGYYNLPDRARQLDQALAEPKRKWDVSAVQTLQLDVGNGYARRVLDEILPVLKSVVTDDNEKAFLEPLEKWDGTYTRDSIAATLFSQFLYELAKAAMADELGEELFASLLRTRALDHALPLLVADEKSPWWDNVKTTKRAESRYEIAAMAWHRTYEHLSTLYGSSLLEWAWGKAHTLTHNHPLGQQKPLNLLFNVGPFAVPGGRETPNNLSGNVGPAPWAVSYGPSTRRVIDFANPAASVGINPVGQSGVLFDRHYDDQALPFAEGIYQPQHLAWDDVRAHRQSTLSLRPAP
ncbi:penicillin acylase family protein [Curvibacter sp. APW13]|uniref:penicillin acylase family protein n=1 Tax=Curvibacter sp. APW13 TaxID=3077236 RepID=UPI0028E03899|nr:penicillin acylase family protein [Curvibacter sp. APW13]MDT8991217.1 penicillin acylase family protein [Curvibacter sp. APW13]